MKNVHVSPSPLVSQRSAMFGSISKVMPLRLNSPSYIMEVYSEVLVSVEVMGLKDLGSEMVERTI
ncbi:hypothetical protein R80B4_02203 [Fibrobacteres bacterium R8-0-B4]